MLPPALYQCAIHVAPQTIAAIVHVESGGNSLTIGVNGPIRNRYHPRNRAEAVVVAQYFISLGYSVDLGLMQVNSNNLPKMGYTVADMFNPCTNLQAGSRILARGYKGAIKRYGEGQTALRAALSAYNTGNYEKGFQNGYVAKYYPQVTAKRTVRKLPTRVQPVINPYIAETTVYRAKKEVMIANAPS